QLCVIATYMNMMSRNVSTYAGATSGSAARTATTATSRSAVIAPSRREALPAGDPAVRGEQDQQHEHDVADRLAIALAENEGAPRLGDSEEQAGHQRAGHAPEAAHH